MAHKTEMCCKFDPQVFLAKNNNSNNNNSFVTKGDSRIVPKNVEIMKEAPFWSGVAIKDAKIVNMSIDDYRGNYLVLIFYPYDFTTVCPTEILQFSDRVGEFEARNCNVVMVSTDSEFAHLAWSTTPRKQGGLSEIYVPMLSDKNHEISRAYRVYDPTLGISYRGLFVIDEKSIVRHVTINDIAIPRSVDEVLRVIDASKFVDEHGNICPIGPIDKNSIKPPPRPGPEEKGQHFSTDLITNEDEWD